MGYEPDANEQGIVLWTIPHNNEQNFLVATRPMQRLENEMADEGSEMDQALKAPPVSLITVSIPIQFQITNVMHWAYQNKDATNLLSSLATRRSRPLSRWRRRGRFVVARTF